MPCHSWGDKTVRQLFWAQVWSEVCGRDGRETDFSFFDAGVDGIQQVSSVLVALGKFSQFFPNQLPLVVAHHLLECWVHIL